jgi:multidrug resistance efflux pump
MVFVTGLATIMKCDRVSLGFVKKSSVWVEAISHSATFGKQMNLVRLIGSAMEEAILQRCEVLYPLPAGAKVLVTRDHEELSRQQAGEAILTIPLHADERYYGALTLERPTDLPFQDDEVKICRGIFSLVAPILEAKRQNDRLLIFKITDSLVKQMERLLGAGYVGRKLALVLLVAAGIFCIKATGEYRIAAPMTLEPLVRRSVVSPFNGYVKEAAVRSGDLVKKGTVLCSLDARDLHLERDKLLNQQTQYLRQRQEAIAASDRAKANIISSQLDQATAQLNLVHSQLKRTSLAAPFEGIVVAGDLSQRIDGSVEQGEVLFEIAPLNSYRVILQVDEYRIADVKLRQRGILVLPALMDRNFEFEVEKITPISTQKEGKNFFRVEAKLLVSSEVLRPGMEGIGKISVDRRRLIAIWTRDLIDWLRMKVWYWWP